MAGLAEQVQAKYPQWVIAAYEDRGDAYVRVKSAAVKDFLSAMKHDADFDFSMLIDIFSVDYLHWEEKESRFELTYNLYSMKKASRLFVKVELLETDPSVDSAVEIWPAANWFEREVWDMMGIVFKGHPNLKRLLMYEGFQGHPLRKDYLHNRRQPIIGPSN